MCEDPRHRPREALEHGVQEEGARGVEIAASKRARTAASVEAPDSEASIALCASVADAAAALADTDCIAALVRRPLVEDTLSGFAEYIESRPQWPNIDELRPLEATCDRVAVIDFSDVASDDTDPLKVARGYGRNLPPRGTAGKEASAKAAIVQVFKVLPESLRMVAAGDAISLLLALRAHTGRQQYILRMELVRGDTCQKWHCDQNICRSLVTYAGPGTITAREGGVQRAPNGCVDAVRDDAAVHISAGDFLIMKGGTWGTNNGRGAAHRAPTIGPVHSCLQHRLLLKVDIAEDF